MKQQINEIKRMQQLAGIAGESQLNEGETHEGYFGDFLEDQFIDSKYPNEIKDAIEQIKNKFPDRTENDISFKIDENGNRVIITGELIDGNTLDTQPFNFECVEGKCQLKSL